ncbi:hypothetical protein [Sphingomonas sp. 28-62-20]|uniref:hypothetical protein n=1 Tax=Sphingomonas sp. 28-62-20 TaxID=1970433 RepID=UPI0035A8EB9B
MMPLNALHPWSLMLQRGQPDPPMPMTLVTLRGTEGACADEVAFYTDAEFDALVDWAKSGLFVMAFVARERDELVLLCTESVEAMRLQVSQLPLVAAGLAKADIRSVATLRLAGRPIPMH